MGDVKSIRYGKLKIKKERKIKNDDFINPLLLYYFLHNINSSHWSPIVHLHTLIVFWIFLTNMLKAVLAIFSGIRIWMMIIMMMKMEKMMRKKEKVLRMSNSEKM